MSHFFPLEKMAKVFLYNRIRTITLTKLPYIIARVSEDGSQFLLFDQDIKDRLILQEQKTLQEEMRFNSNVQIACQP